MILTRRPYCCDIEFRDIRSAVKTSKGVEKVLLDGVSGEFVHGRINVIMGPSGAGKSSLLNALTGFRCPGETSGTILLNGSPHPVKECRSLFSIIGTYVLQSDSLFSQLTVKETLRFAARFKLRSGDFNADWKPMETLLLEKLGLMEAAYRLVGKLSGGQKKRVSIAADIINYPPVLFLDEPTTGLDSVSTYRLVGLLKEIAISGCNVIAVIHQPNSRNFKSFDNLYLLASGGRCAYSGPASLLVSYMKAVGLEVAINSNPADFIFEGDKIQKLYDAAPSVAAKFELMQAALKLDSGENPSNKALQWENFEASSIDGVEESNKEVAASQGSGPLYFDDITLLQLCNDRPSALYQFGLLTFRYLVVLRRDPAACYGRIISALFCMILIGVVFQSTGLQSTQVYFNVSLWFIVNLMVIFPPIIVAVVTGSDNFEVVLRENINSWYGSSVLYWARMLAELPFNLIVLWVIPVWYMTTQASSATDALPSLIFVMFLASVTSQGVGFALGIVVDSRSATFLPFMVAMLTWVFGGYATLVRDITPALSWINWLVYGVPSFRACLKLVYLGNFTLSCPTNLNPMCITFPNAASALNAYDVSPNESIWPDVLRLIIYLTTVYLLTWGLFVLRLWQSKRAFSSTA